MELRHLRYFLAVAEEGSITAAAARLFVAQPALSRQLRDLERHVGGCLFERSSRGVTLTAAGVRLLGVAQQVVGGADALRGVASAAGEADRGDGRFVIGLHDAGLGPVNAPLVATFRDAHPTVDVQVVRVAYGDLDTCLPRGQVDVLLTTAGSTQQDDTVFDGLYGDSLHAVVPEASPLAAARTLSADDVLSRPIVGTSSMPDSLYGPFVLTALRNGDRPRVVDAPPPQGADDLFVQVAYQGAFVACSATEARPYPGLSYVPLTDVPRLASGVAVSRASDNELVGDFRRLAGLTCESLIGLFPDGRLLTA